MKNLFKKASVFFLGMFIINSILCVPIMAQAAKRMTMSEKNITIKQAIGEIEKQGYTFLIRNNDVDLSTKVSIDVKNGNINDVMRQMVKDKNLSYEVNESRITLYSPTTRAQQTPQQSGAAMTVRGTVEDVNGEPVIGANIIVKGTTNGTLSDMDGNFSVGAKVGDVLVVSYIGYTTQEIAIRDRKNIKVVLSEDAKLIDEVVVVGYGTQKKQDITGSVASVGEGKFTEGITTNAFQMINGKAAGVNVSQTSSAPGASTKIQIRGAGSINSSNSALVVVDGLPGVDASSISPNDIKSIEILKDASAAAIYGTRAANGVVLITTKTGRKDQVQVKFSAELGVQNVAKKLDVLNARQYMETLNAIRVESGNPDGKIYTDQQIAAAGEGTNWQDEIFRSGAPVQNYQLSISGGGEKSDYYVGLSYLNQKGIVERSDFTKYNVRANVNMNPTTFLRFKANLNFTRSDASTIYENFTQANEFAGPINSAIQYDPSIAAGVNPETGEYRRNAYIALDNPQTLIYGLNPEIQRNSAYGTFAVEIEPMKDLVFTARLGANIDNTMNSQYRNRLTMNGLASNGVGSKRSTENTQWLAEFLVNYKKNFNDVHHLSVLAGTTFEQFQAQNIYGSSQGFLSDVLGFNSLQSGDQLNGDNVSSYKERNRLHGVIGRINYDYRNRYLLTASFRYDGTSRFSDNKKYAFFPSVALAWRVTEEPFMKRIESVSDLKLRLGYGQLGNQGISNYQTLQTLVSGESAVFGNKISQGVAMARLQNPGLKWETTAETNLGIDFGFINNRITGSIDFFIRDTKDQLFRKPLPSAIGYNSVTVNAGKVRNKGVDLTLNTVNFDRKDFGWDTSVNVSLLNNKVIELPDFMPQLITGSVASFCQNYEITQVGSAIYSYYGYEIAGIWQKGDDIANSAQPSAKPGEPKFVDQDHNNVIDSDDRVVLGKPFPDVTFGFTNTLRWKRFTFSAFLQGVFGINTLDANVVESLYPTNEYRNRLAKYYVNRWTENNPTNKYPSGVNYANYGGQYVCNSLTVVDASYLRIKNIMLTYDVPLKKNAFVKGLNVYGAIDNLATFTSYEGFDPEASAGGAESVSKVNYNSYPAARTFRLGFNVTF